MKKFPTISMFCMRRIIAFSIATALLSLSTSVAFASPADPALAFGTLQVTGLVAVNGLHSVSGETISSGSQIVTASRSNSVLELGNFTRLILSEQTDLAIDFSRASISGSLRHGEMRAFIPAARGVSITTSDGVFATDSSQPVVFSVQVDTAGTRISVETGRGELRSGNNRRILAAGERFSTACDSWAVSPSQQNLSKNEKMGIIAGVGAGITLLLVAMTVGRHKDTPVFGGCVIILSPGAESGC
jgi:ferric-dicitrate binding protein FerR (iron transport regulator)